MKIGECEYHGKYVYTDKSVGCPICAYYYYIEFIEDAEKVKDDENGETD